MAERELSREPPQQPTADTQGTNPLTVERRPVTTPQAFISEVRHTILGDNPESQKVTDFEASLAGKILGVVDGYFRLKTAEEKYPYVKNKYVGSPSYSGLKNPQDKYLTLSVGGQYVISIHENGGMELKRRYSGGNDRLMYNTEDGVGFGLNIDGKTGQVVVLGEGEKQITPNTNSRLGAILDATKAYYDEIHNKLPLGGEHLQASGWVPDTTFPNFPTEEIQALRNQK